MFVGGKIAGGIGVGGGTEEQDCAIAEYVVSVFEFDFPHFFAREVKSLFLFQRVQTGT